MISWQALDSFNERSSVEKWGVKAVFLGRFAAKKSIKGISFSISELFESLLRQNEDLKWIFASLNDASLTPENLGYVSKSIVAKIKKTEPLKEELDFIMSYFVGDEALIVRSNCSVEDGIYGSSFAGIFESVVVKPISPELIWKACLEVFASTYSESALQGLLDQGLAVPDLKPGLLIQKYYDIDFGGVCQSQSDSSSYESQPWIEVSSGGSKAIVDGVANAQSLLPQEIKRRLVKTIQGIEASLHRLVELEWGCKDNNLILFQIRAVHREFRSQDYIPHGVQYSRTIAAERFPKQLSPLSWSLLQDSLKANESFFKKELGLEIGRSRSFSLYRNGWVFTNTKPVSFSLFQVGQLFRKTSFFRAVAIATFAFCRSLLGGRPSESRWHFKLTFLKVFLARQVREMREQWPRQKNEFKWRQSSIRWQSDADIRQAICDLKSTAESFLYRDIFIYFLRENLGKWVQGLWRSEGLSESEFTKWILKTTENPFARSGDKVRKELSADSSFYLFPSWEIFDDPKEFSMVAPSDPKSEVGPQFPGSRALQSHFLWMQEIANIDDGLNFGAHQLLYKTREVLWTLSNEMVKAHHIGSSQDLFYLTVTDLRNYLTLPRNLKELVRRRKRIWQMNVNQPEPWEFPHHGKEKSAAINQNSLTDKKVLQGQGNAMGRIEGLVYQLQNLDFIEDIPVGAIVVTKVPHPILLRKFANIKGIVSETGSRLSHGIVLASEYNIPVVSSLPGIVEHLQTGDSVMLDSYSGEVSFSETL